MTAPFSNDFETIAPTEAESQLAMESSRLLASRKTGDGSSGGVRIQILDDGDQAKGDQTEVVTVPASAVRLFLHLLTEMA